MPDGERVIEIEEAEHTLLRLLRSPGFILPHDDRNGLVVLLRGRAGTGKSTLALQLLDRMHMCARHRIYCTLEQSKQDLEAKRAKMWATRAVDNAWVPKYGERTLVVDLGLLRDTLQTRLGQEAALAAVATLPPMTMPLFGEPSREDKKKLDDFLDTLTETVQKKCRASEAAQDVDQIEIWDETSTGQAARPSQPFVGIHRRCVTADRMVDELYERNCEAAKGPGGPELKDMPEVCDSKAVPRARRPIVVLDGLSLLSPSDREAVALQAIIEKLRQRAQLAIIVYEPNLKEAPYLDHHADMVIELTERAVGQPDTYLIHEMCIAKARYQEAALGRHQFKIRGSGILILPSLHFQVHHHQYMDMELKRSAGEHPEAMSAAKPHEVAALEKGSLIDLICRPSPGEAVVLLGPRNAFKSALCLDYLSCGTWGCPQGKAREVLRAGLLVSLIDNAPDIQHGLRCPWAERSTECPWRNGGDAKACDPRIWHARPYCQRPGYITPAEFFHYLKRRMSEMKRGDRVVFWDLTQMDYRFPLFRDDRMLLPALMDAFRTQEMRSLFMGAGNARNTRAASAMADHVVFCWRSGGQDHERSDAGPGRVASEGSTGAASLMLYVDRASAASNRPGQALYRIPIGKDDKLEIGEVGKWDDRPDANRLRVDLPRLDPNDPDRRVIRRITSMQDVPGEMGGRW